METTSLGSGHTDAFVRVVLRLAVFSRDLRRLLAKHLKSTKLNDTQFLLLFACRETANQGISQIDLAALVGVSPAQMSSLVEQLQSQQLLETWRCPTDRRKQRLRLTAGGHELLSSALTQIHPLVAQVAPGGSELQAVEFALQRLNDRETESPVAGRIHPDTMSYKRAA